MHRLCYIMLIFALASPLEGCERLDMKRQPHYKALQPSSFFANGASARPLVDGTVAQRDETTNDAFETGWRGEEPITELPFEPTMKILLRGQDRFNIYCAPCHGLDGSGDGIIVERGYTAPPSFHTDRLRITPVGFLFSVVTNGFGRMPSYAQQVNAQDRWAIIAYIRALQLSQHATGEQLLSATHSQQKVSSNAR